MNILKNKVFWIITGIVAFLIILAVVLVLCLSGDDASQQAQGEVEVDAMAEELYELNMECIEVEVGKWVHGTAFNSFEVTVTMPDYTKLYKETYKSSDPQAAIMQRLRSGDYEKKTIDSMAEAEYKNGKEVANTEKLVKFLLECELIEATNAVWEAEQ